MAYCKSEQLARQHAYKKPDGTQIQDDFWDDAYLAPAIDAVKLQVKRGRVRLAVPIEGAAGGTLPSNLRSSRRGPALQVSP
jgi:hypothetical protein